MNAELLLWASVALVGLGLSALFSGLETGLYTINRVRLTVRASRHDRRAERLRRFIQNPTRMLGTLLIGNNIANYLGSFGVAAMLDVYGVSPVSAIAINACILIPLLFIFGETLPKDLFRTHTDRWSYPFAGFLTWCERLLLWTGVLPAVQGVGALAGRAFRTERGDAPDELPGGAARQRISQLIKEGAGAGVLSESQTSLADRALALREVRVGSEMVPWKHVSTLRDGANAAERIAMLRRQPHTRVPVVNAQGRVVGVVSVIDALLEADKPLTEMMVTPTSLSPSMPVREALRAMRGSACPLAIVTHPRTGAPIGIVTLKDLVEPLTGELAAW